MSLEENLRAFDTRINAVNDLDVDRVVGMCAEPFVGYVRGAPGPLQGTASIPEGFEGFLAMYPDARWTREPAFGQGS